ncbi:MAG: hypothetical protein INR62_08080 [Rhodospirillales bacterium]|nr:hypothetical protein [Acetobacter sp.]
MKVDPFHCNCCPAEHKDLLLIETRFEGQQCFAELQCRICNAFWTAEIGPAPGSTDLLTTDFDHQPGWRVLDIHRRSSI